WDSVYRTDVEHFKTRGDFGDIWFGEDSALRIIRWIIENVPETDVSIIDLGCGNGMLLIELAREGYNNLTGVDYCQSAIELSEKVANSQEISCIKFKVADLTGDVNHLGSFNIALDKGTYDAVSLNPEDAFVKRRKYIENVASIVSQKGMFIITSCNWTESELVEHFKSGKYFWNTDQWCDLQVVEH
ncbi:hypothetical protein AAG570_002962, partial [Ranatra chinensis]